MMRPPLDSAADAGGAIARHAWIILALTLLLQFALQSYFFPLGELLSPKPLNYIDSPFHQYQMEVARSLCAQHRLVGYDPFFAAGHLGGVTFNASAKLPALIVCALGAPEAVTPVYKVFSFAMGVLAPAALVLAGALLRFDIKATAILAVLAIVNWWTGPMRWYHTAGLVSYVAVAWGAVPFGVALTRTCRAPGTGRLLGVALAAALGALIHPLFVPAAALLCAPLLLTELRGRRDAATIAWVTLVCICAVLALNGAWLHATLAAPNLASAQPYQRDVDPWLVLNELRGAASTASGGSRLYLAILTGAVAAMFLSAGETRRRLGALVAAAALLMLWASVGAMHPGIAALQPNRFSAFAWLVAAVPAAWGAAALWHTMLTSRGARRAVAATGLAAMGTVVLFMLRDATLEVFAERAARHGVTHPEVKGEGPLSTALVSWIRTETDPSARIYFENSLARIHDGAHMAGAYALQTGREFIGGPYPFTDFASGWDGWAFGRPLKASDGAGLSRYLDLYNVKWILCHSEACRATMAGLPDAAQTATIGPVTAFTRRMAPSYFFAGKGTVLERCINRIEVEAMEADEVVLKYHWVPGLVAEPPVQIEKRSLLDDPRPFIAIAHPPKRFSLGVGKPAASCRRP